MRKPLLITAAIICTLGQFLSISPTRAQQEEQKKFQNALRVYPILLEEESCELSCYEILGDRSKFFWDCLNRHGGEAEASHRDWWNCETAYDRKCQHYQSYYCFRDDPSRANDRVMTTR